jgi:hypothetical protein
MIISIFYLINGGQINIKYIKNILSLICVIIKLTY